MPLPLLTSPARARPSRAAGAVLLRRCLRRARPQLVRSVAWAVLRQCAFVALPWVLGLAVDSAIRRADPARAAGFAGALLAVACAEYAGMRGWQLWSNLAEAEAGAWLRTRLLRAVLEDVSRPVDGPGEPDTDAGDLTTRAGRDVESVVYWVHGLTTWVVIGTTVLLLGPALAGLDPVLLLVAALTVPVLLVNRVFPPLYGARSAALAEAHARRSGTVGELLSAMVSLRGVGADRVMVARHRRDSAEVTRQTLRLGGVSALWEATAFAVPRLAVVVGLLAGGGAVLDGRISVGQLTAFVLWMGTVAVAVGAAVARLGDRADAVVAAERIAVVLSEGATGGDSAPDADGAPGGATAHGPGSAFAAAAPGPAPDTCAASTPGTARGIGVVSGAGAAPGPGSAPGGVPRPRGPVAEGVLEVAGLTVCRAGRDALGPFALSARAGEWVAVTGPTGSGKSSLLRALAGLLPASGTATLDGRPLRGAPHLTVGLVPEAPLLLTGTVTENLLLTGDHPRDALDRACRAAGLDLALAGLPDGTGTEVGVRGRALSGGQRQLVALARALLHDSPVLLFDDTTSALDAATEAAVLARLRAATAGRVVVFATHSPAVRALADHEVTLPAPRTDPRHV
ncbi:ATP-binding cassette domain-containing protein [Streptomyces sp. NPDC048182]|uniref:ATP-binding cassette domain-containing protein n=1 Tax=Streptomyces sp. NPDC048182 TaxID=3365507 RepID=UPI00371064BD